MAMDAERHLVMKVSFSASGGSQV